MKRQETGANLKHPLPSRTQGLSFQLIIRHNIRHEAASFTGAEVAVFESGAATVGTHESCECQVLDSEEEEADSVWFRVEPRESGFVLARETVSEIYLNNQPVARPETELSSGDVIRVGHWTFCFQKRHPRARFAKSADWPVYACKTTVGLLVILQLILALWPTGRLRYEGIVGRQIAEEQTILMVDQVRRHINSLNGGGQSLTARNALIQVLGGEIDQMANYMRRHREAIPREKWQRLREDLDMHQELVDDLDRGDLPIAVPELETNAALLALTEDRTSADEED